MKWRPEKRTGVLLQTPINKDLRSTQSNSGVSIAQACEHRATVTQRLPAGHKHFSKEICIQCGAFVRWLPKPETVQRQRLNAFRLARLAMRPDLTGWERQFIRSVGEKKHLSPKQQALVERLCREYLETQTLAGELSQW